MDLRIFFIWIICLSCNKFTVEAGPIYTDCEHPPTILHGRTELSVDDQGVVVIANYQCESNYKLIGQPQLTCDTDTDEWQGELPECKLEGEQDAESTSSGPIDSSNSASSIDTDSNIAIVVENIPPQTEVTAPSVEPSTASNDLKEVVILSSPEAESTEAIIESTESSLKKKRRKEKLSATPEDERIDAEFASHLDNSCTDNGVEAPSVGDSFVREYTYARKENFEFIVAIYACDEDFELLNANVDRLYCSNREWIGDHPACVPSQSVDSDYATEAADKNHGVSDKGDSPNSFQIQPTDTEVEPITDDADNTHDNEIPTNETPTKPQVELHADNQNDCNVNNGGCDHTCNMGPSADDQSFTVQCACNGGYYLDSNEKSCIDINECENNEIEQTCPNGCENLPGSYRCLENNIEAETIPPPIDGLFEASTPKQHPNAPLKACGDGLKLDESNVCVDINECNELDTGCEICMNTFGAYHCMCPDGFEINSDGKTCRDIDECTTYSDYEYDDNIPNSKSICSHVCINTVGSFVCKCPAKFHLKDDNRTCERDFCRHLNDIDAGRKKCSHDCIDDDSGYQCKCPDNMDLDMDEKTCISLTIENVDVDADVDHCAQNNGNCSDVCNVVNGDVVCSCFDGFELGDDGKRCQRTSICAANNGGCEQICNAETNRCECFPGFETFDDGKTCHDSNECLLKNGGCAQQCVNTVGGFDCECFDGYTKDAESGDCIDVDECQLSNGYCDDKCINTQGSFYCSCRPGFQLSNQKQCVDINECDVNNGNCSHTCINVAGSFQCGCPEGQFLVNDEHTCEYLNECEVNNGGCSHTCAHKKSELICECPPGYDLDDDTHKTCIDRNECLINNGGCSHKCYNLIGSHQCTCNAGYQLASDHGTCIDMDECIEDNGNCSNICINLIGSYQCSCEAGFELHGDNHTCIDVDECSRGHHDCAQICTNSLGGYECECRNGFQLSRDHFTCDDIDECADDLNECVDKDKCTNTVGSYFCECEAGFQLAPDHTCVDIDECHGNKTNHCSHTCENVLGSYRCACPDGWELAADQMTCSDIDECGRDDVNECSHQCNNTDGSYHCLCPVGYELNADRLTCRDINECAQNNGGCEQVCVNIDGGVRCECDVDDFVLAGDQKHCVHRDPCGIRNGGCAHVCEKNADGVAQCFCYRGFELSTSDNRTCIDIDECRLNHGCKNECVNTIGSYRCECPKGFRLTELGKCVDINECEESNGGCSPNADCINFIGSYRCICPTGYKLEKDKSTCAKIKEECIALPSPDHGDVHCSRSRLISHNYYKTKCTFTCSDGYTLTGPAVKYCNGSDGIWDATEISCVPAYCPALVAPQNGALYPDECLHGNIGRGGRCTLRCSPGFQPNSADSAECLAEQKWTTTDLHCVELPNLKPKTFVQAGGSHHSGQYDLDQAQSTIRTQSILKPYIRCPQDTTILLPANQKTVYVKFEQPKSNVDYNNHVDAHPAWAKNLRARLAAGVHTIKFRARSPQNASVTDVCQTVISVNSAQPTPTINYPEVVYCPPSIDIQLEPNENQRPVFWKDPKFNSDKHLKQILASQLPGTKFSAGRHNIVYTATDLFNRNATCRFVISLTASPVVQRNAYTAANYHQPLSNHVSSLICPDKPAMKLDTSFPIQIPPGCFIKNVRLRHYNPHHRRQAYTPFNNSLRYYSSWNRPRFTQYY